MIDFLLQLGVSNLLISIALATVAYATHRSGRAPGIAHLLWALVLMKLVTPPIITFPVIAIPAVEAPVAERAPELLGTVPITVPDDASLRNPVHENEMVEPGLISRYGKVALLAIWLVGSAWVLAWSLVRIYRFNRVLSLASRTAPTEIQRTAHALSARFGLKSTPTIFTTTAQLSPMVWWVGGPVRIVIPEALALNMNRDELRWILAHEIAHVRRRDHLIRWLEWSACVTFWWNPIAWWARNLRINEEICCDALVLETLRPEPKIYAHSLMNVVEFLTAPALRPPAVASEINSGGILEERFNMIISTSTNRISKTPGWIRASVLALSVALLPLGVAYAQDVEAVGKRLREAIEHGELSPEQAAVMLDALKKNADQQKNDVAIERHMADIKRLVSEGDMSPEDGRRAIAHLSEVAAKSPRVYDERQQTVVEPDLGDARLLIDLATKFEQQQHKQHAEHLQQQRQLTAPHVLGESLEHLGHDDQAQQLELKALLQRIQGTSSEQQDRALELLLQSITAADPERHLERHLSEKHLAQMQAELDKRVAEGRVSLEDANSQLVELRLQLDALDAAQDHEQSLTWEKYELIEAELKQAIAANKVSIANAARQLEDMRKVIEMQEQKERQQQHADWSVIHEALMKAAESHGLSRDDANELHKVIVEELTRRVAETKERRSDR